MKQFAGSVFLCFTLFFSCRISSAQPFWTKVALPNIYQRIAPYFLNQDIGYVFDISSLTTQSNLRRTSDGGLTWAALRYFDDANILIQQLFFTDTVHGYAAGSDGVYETSDAG
ncbi:MAG: hypothetical protein ACHQM6_08780, partial [Candidatus Kapaibacterium sp.]